VDLRPGDLFGHGSVAGGLAAGLREVRREDHRLGIGGRPDLMNAMAVDAIRLGRPSETNGDPVKTLDEGPDPVLWNAVFSHDFGTGMADRTRVGDMGLRRRRLGRGRGGDGVLAVAIHAEGDIGVPLQRFTAVDAAGVFLEDQPVAFAAGRRVLGREMGRAHALDIVNAVTVRADRGEIEQALVVEAPAVDALAIFLVG